MFVNFIEKEPYIQDFFSTAFKFLYHICMSFHKIMLQKCFTQMYVLENLLL